MVLSQDQNAGRSHTIKIDNIVPLKMGTVQIFGNNFNIYNSIQEEIKSRECLLSCGAESFVFQFATQKYKD